MHFTGLAPLVSLVAEGEAGGDPVAGRTPILPLWGELIFGIIAFGLLYYVVAKKVVPNLEKAYAARAAAIEGGMAQAEEAQAAAEAAKAQYEAQLKDARTEASQIREDARAQGSAIVTEMRGQAQAEATCLPEGLDYLEVRGLSREVQQKLNLHKPETIGQASRIQGMTPAAMSLLLVWLSLLLWVGRAQPSG